MNHKCVSFLVIVVVFACVTWGAPISNTKDSENLLQKLDTSFQLNKEKAAPCFWIFVRRRGPPITSTAIPDSQSIGNGQATTVAPSGDSQGTGNGQATTANSSGDSQGAAAENPTTVAAAPPSEAEVPSSEAPAAEDGS